MADQVTAAADERGEVSALELAAQLLYSHGHRAQAATVRAAQGRIAELDKLAQGYYGEASEGWTKFRHCERQLAEARRLLRQFQLIDCGGTEVWLLLRTDVPNAIGFGSIRLDRAFAENVRRRFKFIDAFLNPNGESNG